MIISMTLDTGAKDRCLFESLMTHFCFCKSSAHLSQPIFPNESHELAHSNEWEAQDGPEGTKEGRWSCWWVKIVRASFSVAGLVLCFPLKSKSSPDFPEWEFLQISSQRVKNLLHNLFSRPVVTSLLGLQTRRWWEGQAEKRHTFLSSFLSFLPSFPLPHTHPILNTYTHPSYSYNFQRQRGWSFTVRKWLHPARLPLKPIWRGGEINKAGLEGKVHIGYRYRLISLALGQTNLRKRDRLWLENVISSTWADDTQLDSSPIWG